MKNYEFKVGWCSDCHQGWIEIVKEKKSDALLLECSECSIQWRSLGSRERASDDFSSLGDSNGDNDLNYVVFDLILDSEYPDVKNEDDEDFDSIKTIQTTKPTFNQIQKNNWDPYILQD